ncbi:MAG: hypothetical protein HY595_01745, partial [Candidatus Omnitrophica bacterium]|nr:hypothetical protein [Candidatus Omnitrophota bacterium]
MRSRTRSSLLCRVFFLCLLPSAFSLLPSVAEAGWVWTPQTGWIGPAGAVKDSPEEQLVFAIAFFDR